MILQRYCVREGHVNDILIPFHRRYSEIVKFYMEKGEFRIHVAGENKVLLILPAFISVLF